MLRVRIACVAAISMSGLAHAQTSPAPTPKATKRTTLPVPLAQRPLSMPQGTLAAAGVGSFSRVDIGRLDLSGFGLVGSLQYGLLDDLLVSATLLTVALETGNQTDVELGAPSASLLYRFTRGDTEIGALVGVVLPLNTDTRLRVALPLRIHGGRNWRIDTGLDLVVTYVDEPFLPGTDAQPTLGVPIGLTVQAAETLAFGLSSGLFFVDFKGNQTAVPLELRSTWTLKRRAAPVADVSAALTFPAFFLPGVSGNKLFIDEAYALSLGVTFYLN